MTPEDGQMDRKEESGFIQNKVFETTVRAGKRTYFFDVRSTRNSDYYLTITESKRKLNSDGTAQYLKHKIFLYKEDFDKFKEALNESMDKVMELLDEKSSQESYDSYDPEQEGQNGTN